MYLGAEIIREKKQRHTNSLFDVSIVYMNNLKDEIAYIFLLPDKVSFITIDGHETALSPKNLSSSDQFLKQFEEKTQEGRDERMWWKHKDSGLVSPFGKID